MPTIQPAPRARPWHGGPPPKYQPRFSDAEVAQARAWARAQAVPHGEVQRARLVLLLHQQPDMRSPEAPRRLGQSPSWVCKWRRRWVEQGFSLGDAPRPGRPQQFADLGAGAGDRHRLRAAEPVWPASQPPLRQQRLAGRPRRGRGHQAADGAADPGPPPPQALALRELDASPRSQVHREGPGHLDLYAGRWEGRPLERRDQIISADEKTSIQARRRRLAAAGPGQPGRMESDYQRLGALQYLCAWDVRRGIPWGRCESKTGIAAFTRLVDQVMAMEPYRSAPRVFWIVDNGSSHQGTESARRLRERHPNLILVHTPTHASWLNQIEVFFSIVQRKVLTPAVADDLAELAARILAFEAEYRRQPRPFRWKFTRADFDRRLSELEQCSQGLAA